jgi:hypothetical protein
MFLVCFWKKRADFAKASFYKSFVKRRKAPGVGFEPTPP